MRRPALVGYRLVFLATLSILALISLLAERGEARKVGRGITEPHRATTPPTSATQAHVAPAPAPWAVGQVVTPQDLFCDGDDELDRSVLAANPRLYLRRGFDGRRQTTLVVGMPGWGGRSENFIWTLINGINDSRLGQNLALAAIQDTRHGGPRYQGQGDRKHANTWFINRTSVKVMQRFVARMSGRLGRGTRVFFVGYSTGGVSAPVLAARLPDGEGYHVEGSVVLGTGTTAAAEALLQRRQRVLFVVVPRRRAGDPRPLRDDQYNREQAEQSTRRLAAAGVTAHLRHIPSARRHRDWHWGLISECRYFPGQRVDAGRGFWPNYWMPNPQTTEVISAFIRGDGEPPVPSERYVAMLCPN